MKINLYPTGQLLYKNNFNNNNKSEISFKSNPDSKMLLLKPCDFFINIDGYGTNYRWARKTKSVAESAVKLIRKNKDFDEVMPYIAKGMKVANGKVADVKLNDHTGRIRAYRPNYGEVGDFGNVKTGYNSFNKYAVYKDRLDKRIEHPLKNPYSGINFLTTISKGKPNDFYFLANFMNHGKVESINPALDIAKNIYNKLQIKYISKPEKVTDKTLKNINSNVAEIRWIIAHSMPWERGSDSIGNTFMRALYKSMGIKAPALKKNISLDLEAYCTDLKSYKKKFPTYFEYPPKVID